MCLRKMSKKNITYISVNQAIDDAVAKYKENHPIDDCLLWINDDAYRLTNWAYETDIFFDENYVFLTSEDELFHTHEDLLEYYDTDRLDLKTDSEILSFINNQVDGLFEDATAAHFHHRDNIVITADCEIWGQSGPHFSNFNIHSSKEAYFKYLVDRGCMLWFTKFLSHSEADLIAMFKNNITNKYFAN